MNKTAPFQNIKSASAWAAEGSEGELPEDHPQPVGHQVLLRPLPPKQKTASGIVLPDTAIDAEELATCVHEVVAIGPGAFRDRWSGRWQAGYDEENPPFRVGDHVSTPQYSGHKMLYRGIRLIMVEDDAIVALVPDPAGVRAYIG